MAVSDSSVKGKFKKFYESPVEEREFHFLKKDVLVQLARNRRIRSAATSSIAALITALAAPAVATTPTAADQTADPTTDGDDEPSTREKVIQSILEKSFQPQQKGKLREYCNTGHRLELPILANFCRELDDPLQDHPHHNIRVKSAFTAGLVEKKAAPWVKDSIDFIIAVQDVLLGDGDEDEELWGVEIKSRVTASSAASEENFILDTDRAKHMKINYADVHRYLPKVSERYQILHHAYTYDFEKVIIIVGDESGKLIQSTLVHFSPEVKAAYGRVLHRIKTIGLTWLPFYESNDGEDGTSSSSTSNSIDESILSIADSVKTINGREALLSSIWMLNSMLGQQLPLPSCSRIIPIYCAYWNAVKGGSDTTTKLMDDL